MLNQSSTVFNPASLYLPQNLPILQKCGRVNTHLRYHGLNSQGELTEYEVKRAVASMVAQGFTFANVPYAFFQPVGELDGWQVFHAECGQAMIPANDYRRLLSVGKRTAQGRQSTNKSRRQGTSNPHNQSPTKQEEPVTMPNLNLSPEQKARIRAFILKQTAGLDNLLTNEQRQVAAALLHEANLWVDNWAGVFRAEGGRLMLYPDPQAKSMINEYPRIGQLAQRMSITTEFAPVDMTYDDWRIVRALEPIYLIAHGVPYAAA